MSHEPLCWALDIFQLDQEGINRYWWFRTSRNCRVIRRFEAQLCFTQCMEAAWLKQCSTRTLWGWVVASIWPHFLTPVTQSLSISWVCLVCANTGSYLIYLKSLGMLRDVVGGRIWKYQLQCNIPALVFAGRLVLPLFRSKVSLHVLAWQLIMLTFRYQ